MRGESLINHQVNYFNSIKLLFYLFRVYISNEIKQILNLHLFFFFSFVAVPIKMEIMKKKILDKNIY